MMINNLPTYALEKADIYPYTVCREVDNELWFYGCYKKEKAYEVAREVKGVVVDTPHLRKRTFEDDINLKWLLLNKRENQFITPIEKEMIQNEKRFLECMAF